MLEGLFHSIAQLLLGLISLWLALLGVGACVVACIVGMAWQSHGLTAGGDYAEGARARLGLYGAVQRAIRRWQALQQPQAWVRSGRLEIGCDELDLARRLHNVVRASTTSAGRVSEAGGSR